MSLAQYDDPPRNQGCHPFPLEIGMELSGKAVDEYVFILLASFNIIILARTMLAAHNHYYNVRLIICKLSDHISIVEMLLTTI